MNYLIDQHFLVETKVATVTFQYWLSIPNLLSTKSLYETANKI